MQNNNLCSSFTRQLLGGRVAWDTSHSARAAEALRDLLWIYTGSSSAGLRATPATCACTRQTGYTIIVDRLIERKVEKMFACHAFTTEQGLVLGLNIDAEDVLGITMSPRGGLVPRR